MAEERVQTNVRLPKDLHERITENAKNRGVSVNYLVIVALQSYLYQLDNQDLRSVPRTATGGIPWSSDG